MSLYGPGNEIKSRVQNLFYPYYRRFLEKIEIQVTVMTAPDNIYYSFILFVEPACCERDIVVTISVRYMCILQCACIRPSIFVWAITSTFMHGFQNNLLQLFSLRSRSAI